MLDRESNKRRRRTMQQVSYSGRPAVATLNDGTLAAAGRGTAPVQVQTTEPRRSVAARSTAADRYGGLYGFQEEPKRAIQPSPQGKIRRAGLQDHISAAFKRTSGRLKAEPTEAVRDEFEVNADSYEVVEFEQPDRQGLTRARGSFERQPPAANQNNQNVRSDRFDDYEKMLVRHEAEFDDDFNEPAEFAD